MEGERHDYRYKDDVKFVLGAEEMPEFGPSIRAGEIVVGAGELDLARPRVLLHMAVAGEEGG